MRLFTIVLIVLFFAGCGNGGLLGGIVTGIFLLFVWLIAAAVWSSL